ncbi:MAG: sorbosone dehydrogenase family protein [Bacteroidota bacterium]
MQNRYITVILAFLILLTAGCISINRPWKKVESLPLDQVQLPDGFQIELYAKDVANARSMTWGDEGTLFVGTRSEGKVYALRDEDGDFKADKLYTLAADLEMPNGVAFYEGALYVAGVDRIWRLKDIESKLENPPALEVVTDVLPDKKWHGWKYIQFGPDQKLYVPVGAPCNVCEEENTQFATIMRMNPDGSELEVFASGIRNSVGFDWHPQTQELWFTNNGRDMLGEDIPSDELNRAYVQGLHFGFPYCHQGDILDPKFGEDRICEDFEAPVQKLGPHVAALGMKFYDGKMFPSTYQSSIFIAEHGSWNRKEPSGYRITRVPLSDNQSQGYEVFAEGWLSEGTAWGRPVDILEMEDGSILVSDDHANAIYRISYNK